MEAQASYNTLQDSKYMEFPYIIVEVKIPIPTVIQNGVFYEKFPFAPFPLFPPCRVEKGEIYFPSFSHKWWEMC